MTDPEKAELLAEIAAARARIATTGTALKTSADSLRHTFNIPARAKVSFEKHRSVWLSGAALFGLLLSKLPARKKTVFVEHATGATGKLATAWSLFKFASGLAKPFLGDLAAKWIAARAEKAAGAPPPGTK